MDLGTVIFIIFIVLAIAIVVYVVVGSNFNVNQALTQQQDVGNMIDNGTTKETFFAIGADGAKVTEQGTIVGPHIYTNGLLNQPWDEIVDAVKTGKDLGDKTVLGAGPGDKFEVAWGNHLAQEELVEGKEIGVKTPEEIAAIEKKISGVQNNNSSCLYTRGGSTKAKIILDPLGCRGVTDSYDTPERERNHKIFDGGSVVYVPGFNINISNLGKEMTYKGKGWGKDFAGNTVHEFTSPETKRIEEGALQSIGEGTAMETFSARN